MKKILFLVFVAFGVASAQEKPYQPTPENLLAREQFQNDKFGMFIHWGVYSVLGDGEWVMEVQKINKTTYEKIPHFFNPTAFDAKRWVAVAKSAGMKYITITTKHHDGFAMWGSKVSKYNIVEATPYGKDVIKMLADECQKADIKLFLYHSHLDWHHPDYFPRGKTGKSAGRPETGNFDAYLNYMDTQLAELLDGSYGKVAGIWFDGWWDQAVDENEKSSRNTRIDWQLKRTYDKIHKLQPATLIGNNHHVAPFDGEDFQMFEKDLPGENSSGFNTKEIGKLPLETCETINNNWGFSLQDASYKSVKQLVQYLVNAAGRNANFLLNIGPMPNGEIQPEFVVQLEEMGKWTNKFGETIYGTRGGIIPPQSWGVSTQKTEKLHYLHLLKTPEQSFLFVPNFKGNVLNISLFDGKKPIKFKQQQEGLFIYLDGVSYHPYDTILELILK